MPGGIKRWVVQVARSEVGFTMIEMIMVVAIVSVLAAIVTPKVVKLIDLTDFGAQKAELRTVKTALHLMMADQGITDITSRSGGASVNDWTSLPAGGGTSPLRNYLETQSTVYFYCYDSNGSITRQDVVATAACP